MIVFFPFLYELIESKSKQLDFVLISIAVYYENTLNSTALTPESLVSQQRE